MYKPSKEIDLKIVPGDPVRNGSIAESALQKREKITSHVGADVFVASYFGQGTPLFDNQRVPVATITFVFPPETSPLLQPLPRNEFLIGRAEDRFVPVHLRDIIYFSSVDGVTYMHTQQEKYHIRYTLQELVQILPPTFFVRCHRAFIVNVSGIRHIHKDFHSTFLIRMKDAAQTSIPVSQKYASAFRRSLGF